MKKCNKCNKTLPYTSFYKDKNLSDSYRNTCKECCYKSKHNVKKQCVTCGETFLGTQKQKYCCRECKPQHKKERYYVDCSYCGKKNIKQVTKSRLNRKNKHGVVNFYCDDRCKDAHYGILYSGVNSFRYNSFECKCLECGKIFNRTEYEIKKNGGKYCSRECAVKNYPTMFSGVNNPNYNPNKSDEDRIINRNIEGYNEWQRQVYSRDNYTCQCCLDDTGGNLNAHHIYNYMEYPLLRIEVDNGITLCKSCHVKFHNIYGYKNNNLLQMEEFLNRKLNMVIPSQALEKSNEGVETNKVV